MTKKSPSQIAFAERPRKPSRSEMLNEWIDEINERQKLDSWTSFVDELQVPSDIYPALITQRPQLMRAAPARAMTEQEVKVLYILIAGLIETNAALREHAEQVAVLVEQWTDAFTALQTVGRRIESFANFKRDDDDSKSDEETP